MQLKFQVTITGDQSTRWFITPEKFCRALEVLLRIILRDLTAGSVPAVHIIRDEVVWTDPDTAGRNPALN